MSINPNPYLEKFGKEAGYSDSTISKARQLIDENRRLFIGYNPRTVAIMTLYISGITNDEYFSEEDLVKIAGISRSAFFNAYRILLKSKKEKILKIELPPEVEKILKFGKIYEDSKFDELDALTVFLKRERSATSNALRNKRYEAYTKHMDILSGVIKKLFSL